MLSVYDPNWNEAFRDNLECWCKGGPRPEGWTREGSPVSLAFDLTGEYTFQAIPVTEVLAKNFSQIKKWHLDFLDGVPQLYWSEYLSPRMDDAKADQRMADFCDLLESVREGFFGVAFVAEVPEDVFGFRYFRFDGCHRACCMYHLGHEEMPVCVFKTKRSLSAF